jgi:thioredoxin-like negative regulator of GroEL/DnaJ-domain-containing protein 1
MILRAVLAVLLGALCGPAATAAADDMDLYEVLGLQRDAAASQIKKAYRRLSLQFHPDKHVDASSQQRERNQKRFNELTKAYDTLGDEDKRTVYDAGVGGFTSQWEYERSGAKARDFYSSRSDIETLTGENFHELVEQGQHQTPWLVDFYAPWCLHCQEMSSDWRKAAIALSGKARLGAVNCEKEGRLCQSRNIRAYPQVILYNKGDVDTYEGSLVTDDFVNFVLENTVSYVHQLTESNFGPKVLGSSDLWLVDFYAPWCGPCNRLKPTMKKVAFDMHQKRLPVKIGMVDCTVQGGLCHDLQSYPSIKIFRKGRKSNRDTGTLMNTDRFNRDMAVSAAMYLTTQILEHVLEPEPEELGSGPAGDGAGTPHPEPMVFIDPEVEDNPEL